MAIETSRFLHRWKSLRKASIVGSSLYVISTQIVGKGTSAILSILLARSLTTEQFSTYNYFFITSTLLSSYFSLGLPFAIARVVAEGSVHKSWAHDDRVGAIWVLIASVTAAAFILSPFYLPPLLSDEIPLTGVLVVIGGLSLGWAGLAQAALYAHEAFREAFWPVILGTLLLVSMAAVGVVMHDVNVLICGALIGVLTPTVLYVRYLMKVGIVHRKGMFRTRWRSIGAVLGTSLPGLGIAAIFVTINWLISRTLVEHQVGAGEFAKFALGMQWFSLVLFVPLAFGQVLFPRFLQRAYRSNLHRREATLPAGLTFVLVAVCALAGAAAAPLLVVIYGANYDFSREFVFTILMGAASAGAVNLLGSYVMAVRGTGTWFVVNFISAALACTALFVNPPSTALDAARLLCAIYVVLAMLAYLVIRLGGSDDSTSRSI